MIYKKYLWQYQFVICKYALAQVSRAAVSLQEIQALTQRYSTHLELAKEVNDLYELEGVAKSLLLQAQRNAQIQVGVLLNINS